MGANGEGDLKNRQLTNQSKDKEPLGEMKVGAVRQCRQQGSQYETVADGQGCRSPWITNPSQLGASNVCMGPAWSLWPILGQRGGVYSTTASLLTAIATANREQLVKKNKNILKKDL